MQLNALVEQYVTFRKAFGAVFRGETYTLQGFGRFVGVNAKVTDVNSEQVSMFLAGDGRPSRSWHVKHATLTVFFRYAVGRGYLDSAPMPTVIPKAPPPLVPYIYSQDELRRLFQATATYQRLANCMEPITAHTTLLILYGAGLRLSEAIELDWDDVDLREKVLRIRRTKFFKERLVPVGAQLAKRLATYAKRPNQQASTLEPKRPFLTSKKGRRLNKATVQGAFERIRTEAKVLRQDGGRFQPRLHDLRHTFAVHSLTEWYRKGVDVQKLLPNLSTYMGHRHLSGTMIYLSMTRELLHEASKRFENCFLETTDEETI